MNGQRPLPPIPRPPHDPTWWLLDARVGWREATLEGLEHDPVTQTLVLATLPERTRRLAEASGSFGGLTVPTPVALTARGEVYLLDREALQLKRFDPCTCAFVTVPCFGGAGEGPRQLQYPNGIGIHGGNLYVCDTGNHRLGVFALTGLVLRGHWAPPPAAGLTNPWEPYAVAFDRRGRVWVADRANGFVHRFSPTGRWEEGFPGFGVATHLAVDRDDRVYVVVEGEEEVQIIDTDGRLVGAGTRPERLRSRFPALPFVVDARGGLHLGPLCLGAGAAQDAAAGVFDTFGHPATPAPAPDQSRFEQEGVYISEPLDSKLYRCQWHRIVLRGEVPVGTCLQVATYTAETPPSPDQIAALPDRAWETNLSVVPAGGDTWDGLVLSGGGRYLWLRLRFKGNGTATPRIRSIQVEFPRISLRRYLPAVFGQEPVSADFTDRFLSLFDTTLRGLEHQIDTQARLFDPLSTPADRDPATGVDFLSWLASWIGVTLDRQLPEAQRRRFLKRAARLFPLRGTREGLWRQMLFFLGMEPASVCCSDDQLLSRCRPVPTGCVKPEVRPCAWQPPPLILEHFQLRRWLFLGAGRLGDQAVLWGQRIVNRSQLDANARVGGTKLITSQDPYRDPFHVYAHKFTVFAPAAFSRSPGRRRALENLVQAEKPAHAHAQIVYVAPRFRIGFQSMIGLDAVVGRYPEGVTLDETALGPASVLGEGPYRRGAPTLRVGEQARIGTTTVLD